MSITINFDDIYEPASLSDDFSQMSFNAPQFDGSDLELLVTITQHHDEQLLGVYNLAFGPKDENGEPDDQIRLKHQNIDKVFSTIILNALSFLQLNPELKIGIDGSDDLRARLYHGMFKSNREYLQESVLAIGVDWYVRIFRDYTYEQDEIGNFIARPRPEPFNYERENRDLYRYYMLRLK
ncbi:hypothetical protein OQY15_01125 [Pedobacter sp. MC2016-15]|uniref:DUF6934 family protein n=1 Tax=Pedobacter sp. MC2016-15 TaxID=2994473 RepID=UPI0022460DAC|nr:hypothetical protein [Pedobacter sp. MC2016-15]MCX2477669.1 hypothetical protein [Pedobacter sp. MC2016-15]